MKIKTIEGKETKYDYNYDGKLVKITLPDSNTVQLMYDLIGRMIGVKTKDKNSRIVWDKERIIWESDSVSQTKKLYNYAPGCHLITQKTNSERFNVLIDFFGTPRRIYSANDVLQGEFQYDGFGNPLIPNSLDGISWHGNYYIPEDKQYITPFSNFYLPEFGILLLGDCPHKMYCSTRNYMYLDIWREVEQPKACIWGPIIVGGMILAGYLIGTWISDRHNCVRLHSIQIAVGRAAMQIEAGVAWVEVSYVLYNGEEWRYRFTNLEQISRVVEDLNAQKREAGCPGV